MREVFVDMPSHRAQKIFDVWIAGVSYCDGSYKILRPKSNVFCIEYVIDGVGTVKTKGKTFTAKKGDTYLLLKGERHEYFSSADEPWEKIWVNFDGTLPEMLIDLYGIKDTTVLKCDTYEYFKKMHEVLGDKTKTSNEMLDDCSVILHTLFAKMSRQIKSENSDDDTAIPDDARKLQDYIDKNICDNISIDTLSALLYKSPSQTIRIFKKAHGVTPYEYHLKNKLAKAVSLLESTGSSIKEIAYYLGFSDEHYFSNVFKRKMGKSPSDIERKNKSTSFYSCFLCGRISIPLFSPPDRKDFIQK